MGQSPWECLNHAKNRESKRGLGQRPWQGVGLPVLDETLGYHGDLTTAQVLCCFQPTLHICKKRVRKVQGMFDSL